jgi:hypothetical protein
MKWINYKAGSLKTAAFFLQTKRFFPPNTPANLYVAVPAAPVGGYDGRLRRHDFEAARENHHPKGGERVITFVRSVDVPYVDEYATEISAYEPCSFFTAPTPPHGVSGDCNTNARPGVLDFSPGHRGASIGSCVYEARHNL